MRLNANHTFRVVSLVFLVCYSISLKAQSLSDRAQISVLVAGKGPSLYQSWGHAAILIEDPQNNIYAIYNYGTFNFQTPNFYLKFMQGKLLYFLAQESYETFKRVYRYYNMSMDKLVLNLSPLQKEAFYQYILNNAKEENRYYLYDFFFDNCASRIKDVLKDVLADSLVLSQKQPIPGLTFRQAIDKDLEDRVWTDFGIDLILGAVIDKEMDIEDFTFHPAYLGTILKDSRVLMPNGKEHPLILSESRLIQPRPVKESKSIISPIMVTSLLCLMVALITFLGYRRKQVQPKLDMGIFGTIGIVGLVILFMWVGTDHGATASNLNILWALPSHAFIAFALRNKQLPSWLTIYLGISAFLLLSLLLGGSLWPQQFHPAIYPVLILLLIRCIFRIKGATI